MKIRKHRMAKTIRTDKERLRCTDLDITNVDKLTRDASEVRIGIVTILAALIGILGIACLIGGVANTGLVDLVKGFISAGTSY